MSENKETKEAKETVREHLESMIADVVSHMGEVEARRRTKVEKLDALKLEGENDDEIKRLRKRIKQDYDLLNELYVQKTTLENVKVRLHFAKLMEQ